MTREKLWEIVTTRLVWVDYWSGESEPSGEIKEILTNSLLIPAPKFKVGDWVEMILGTRKFKIVGALYDYESNAWVYENVFNAFFPESELKLVEEGK